MYLNISGAGLFALFIALFISPVVSIPIQQASQSGLSFSSSHTFAKQQDLVYHVSAGKKIQPQTSLQNVPAVSTTTRALTDNNNADGPELVRRSRISRKIKAAFQKLGRKIKGAFKKVGKKIKQGFQKAGKAIKKGFQKAGRAIKKVAKKVGAGIKKAAQKVGHFIKTTGAKIVKFGLKVVQSVGMVVGKVLEVIPGVGKPLERVVTGVTKVAGVISDRIHVKLGKKLEKGMNVMNKATKIMGYIPRRRDLSEVEAVQQLEIGDAYYSEEPALEHREESYFDADEHWQQDSDAYDYNWGLE